MPGSLPNPHPTFLAKKSKILSQLSAPPGEYVDASPKGSVDVGIRDLIDEINRREGLVTTSSCAGRVSVFVEGAKSSKSGKAVDDGEEEDEGWGGGGGGGGGGVKPASTVGGKGGGGAWLFVSHDPVDEDVSKTQEGVLQLFGLDEAAEAEENGGSLGEGRLIHFKFEPMILHILTASPLHAQLVLKAGLQAGFRESGAVTLVESHSHPAMPMVAIRSMGLGFESLVGVMDAAGRKRSLVSKAYLEMLVKIGNERFVENGRRIGRFLEELRNTGEDEGDGEGKEDKEARRERKKAEGLRRQAEETEGDRARRRRSERIVEQIEFYIDDLERDRNLSRD
ncbi:tRNA wybutosine-synthesizing protein [Coniochaeta sp. 2T2.1]|nr:tRNA wybutosine-synthesizing protein [Coniochaeta sp. 2T2.1]